MLRANLYYGLTDAISSDSDSSWQDAAQFGRRIILPSLYLGLPRCMQQEFQDSLALGRRYG